MEKELPPEPLLLRINSCFVTCFPDGAAVAPGIHPALGSPLAGPRPTLPAAQQKDLPLVAPWPPVLGFHQKGSAVMCGLQAGNRAN